MTILTAAVGIILAIIFVILLLLMLSYADGMTR